MDENKILETDNAVTHPVTAKTSPATEAAATAEVTATPEQAPETETAALKAETAVETEATVTVPAAAAADTADTQPDATATPTDTVDEAPSESDSDSDAATHSARPLPGTKSGIIERLKEIITSGESIDRTEIEALKQAYYKFNNAAVTAAHEAFIAAGGAPEDFTPEPDPDEENFKAQMGRIRELRAQAVEALEKEKQAGLEKKLAIIEKIKNMAASPVEADKNYDTFKALQAEWKEIKNVPAEKATELWKNYQLYVEQFYDQLRLNHEFRAYDFKKNLEIKTRLCEAAEKLADVADPVSAFHQLQKLHQEFRETGPVAKELREEIWKRFKEASTIVNKRHQDHFEQLKAQEEENLAKKEALCERVEAIKTDGLKGFSDWDKTTKAIIALQAEWKTIGFTPKKMNAKIFERFRTACDTFFNAKTAFFKQTRETFAANLAAKNALCEKAEALKDSTDWGATTSKIVALQKEWRTIGPVAHKVSEAVWKRFNTTCNAFFDNKKAATSGQRKEEEDNLTAKNEVISALEALLDNPADDAQQKVRELQTRWNSIGHVPFRKKEKMYQRYHDVCDRVYKELHLSAGRRNLDNFRKDVADKGGNELTRERARLNTAFEAKRQEIQTYETNLSFLSAKSKQANAFVDEVNRKIERLKEDLNLLAEKLKAVNEQIKAGEQE